MTSRRTKSAIGGKGDPVWTPPDPPWTPNTPQKPSWTVPTTNIVHLVTSQLTSNPQMPKCTLKPKKCPKTAQKRQKCKNAKSGKTQNWPILIPHPTTSQKIAQKSQKETIVCKEKSDCMKIHPKKAKNGQKINFPLQIWPKIWEMTILYRYIQNPKRGKQWIFGANSRFRGGVRRSNAKK